MRKWLTTSGKVQKVGVLLFPRFSNHCLANAVEPLRAANALSGRTLYTWTYLTLDGKPVQSSSGLPVLPQSRLSDHGPGDLLFVLPSYNVRSFADQPTIRALRAAAGRFARLAGMDTGSWLLAAAGLLDGRRATIHDAEATAFAEAFPEVEVLPDRVVVDGPVVTCGGAMTAFDLALALIRQTHGEALRLDLAGFFLADAPATTTGVVQGSTGSGLVDAAVAQMLANLEVPLPVTALSARLGVSQKRLGRAFVQTLGAPVQAVYKRLRLNAARRHLEQSSYSVAEIALRCGYRDTSAFARAFAEAFDCPPTVHRRRCRATD